MARKDFKRATASVFLTSAPEKDTKDTEDILDTQNIKNTKDTENTLYIKDIQNIYNTQDIGNTQNNRQPLECGNPYRINLKLKAKFKEYLAWASWEGHESITQYLNRLIEQDYKKRAGEYARYLDKR